MFNIELFMEENFIADILNYAQKSEQAKTAVIHWFWSNIERRRKLIFRQIFEGTELSTIEEYALLNLISLEPVVTLTKATNYLFLERSTTSEILKRFQKKGFISCESDQKDKRVKYFHLTDKGKELIVQANKLMLNMNHKLFESLADKDKFLINLRGIYQQLNSSS